MCSKDKVEERTRKAVKGIHECDVTKEGVLTSGGDLGQFDCVACSLCLEVACSTIDEFRLKTSLKIKYHIHKLYSIFFKAWCTYSYKFRLNINIEMQFAAWSRYCRQEEACWLVPCWERPITSMGVSGSLYCQSQRNRFISLLLVCSNFLDNNYCIGVPTLP